MTPDERLKNIIQKSREVRRKELSRVKGSTALEEHVSETQS